ncbi:MAG: proton-conducting transporter membrane subunit [Candidatus Omnitrophica bacterium]|nr:proton-conducting transporter membrane subunit [Candidatus Omnitrophota bacterium]
MKTGLFLLFSLPLFLGFFILLIKPAKHRGNIALLSFLIGLISSLWLLVKAPSGLTINLVGSYDLLFSLNSFSKFILVFVNFFGLIVCFFSRGYNEIKDNRLYFSLLIWLIAFSNLACLSADFVIFLFGWGATLALLYALLNLGSSVSANKALVVVGFGDFSLILGVCLYIFITGSTLMPLSASVPLDSPLHWLAFVLMLIGAFAKAGCAPFHTWIPTASESAPLPVMAILPGSLDKLLGIYLLARVCSDFFVLNNAALMILLLIGSATIMFAVMLALIQHDLRKLLSFHAISQVGYMVLGFGTGLPIGACGAIFHMINNSIYKSGLFLTGACAAQKKNTFELDKMGGLARSMPVVFVSGVVFALSISGVPPFNGFSSKWMLYQGVISAFSNASISMKIVCILALLSAMFGSVLTLASFIKFIHAIFLGEDKKVEALPKISATMQFPLSVLAILCVLLGVFPYFFIKYFIQPVFMQEIMFTGNWNSLFAFIWIFVGLVAGLIFYNSREAKSQRQDNLFIGGEDVATFGPSFPATEFYKTLENIPVLSRLYLIFSIESFDFYNLIGAVLRLFGYIIYIFIDRVTDVISKLPVSLISLIGFLFKHRSR